MAKSHLQLGIKQKNPYYTHLNRMQYDTGASTDGVLEVVQNDKVQINAPGALIANGHIYLPQNAISGTGAEFVGFQIKIGASTKGRSQLMYDDGVSLGYTVPISFVLPVSEGDIFSMEWILFDHAYNPTVNLSSLGLVLLHE